MMYTRKFNRMCFDRFENTHKFYPESSMEVIFTITRFREYLGLPEFTHLEFEEEMWKEYGNYGADEADVYRSLLLTQIYEILLKKATKKETVKELDVLLVLFTRRHCDPNPFDTMDSCDFHLLPIVIQMWVYQQLLKFHLNSDTIQDVEQWRSPEELRAEKYQTRSGYHYYYFHDMRIFRWHHSAVFERRISPIEFDLIEKEPWMKVYLDIVRGEHFELICHDHVTWAAFIKEFLPTWRQDANHFRAIYRNCVKDHLQDLINLYQQQKASRARLHAQMDLEKRRSLGLFRSSSRLQLKRQLEEESQGSNGDDGDGSGIPSKQLTREERLLRREENKDLLFDIMENKLSVDVSSSGDEKLFDSPQNTSPISLKEVNVDNFRLTNPPISPQLNTFEQNNLNNSFGAPAVAEVPKETPMTEEDYVEPPHVLTEAELDESLILEPPGMTLSPRTKLRLLTFRSQVDTLLKYTGKKGLEPHNTITCRYRTNNTPSTSTSGQQDVTDPETNTPSSSGQQDVNTTETNTPSSSGQQDVNTTETNTPSSSNQQSAAPAPPSARIMFLWKVAIREIKHFHTEVFQKWTAHYRMRMPMELRELFNVHFRDENVHTFEDWDVIKYAIFTTPMKIGRVEEFHVPEKKALKKDAPFRALGSDLLKANLICWPLLWDEMLEEDKVWLSKTEDRLAIIQRLIAADKEKPPTNWNWNS